MDKRIYLKSYEENVIKIDNKDTILIIGTTQNNCILIRIIINENLYYENLFNNIEYNNILLSIKKNNCKFDFNDNKNELYFKYYSISFLEKELILLRKNNENDKFIIVNEKTVKLLYNFNKKYKTNITDNNSIILNNITMSNEGFKELCNINLKVNVLVLINNIILNINKLFNIIKQYKKNK